MAEHYVASVYNLSCPYCRCRDYKVVGIAGGRGKEAGVTMAFGAVGSLIASSMTKNAPSVQPVRYQCAACGKKYESLPIQATEDELLASPCTVNFTRLSAFVGMAVVQEVWLNGVMIGTVKNGQTISFLTNVRHNTVFVTDHYGVAFKGHYNFEAQAGGRIDIQFKRKFQ